MSKRLQVLVTLKALAASALPFAEVKGLDAQDSKPARVGPGGTVVVRSGDPGDPSVDLSPVTYHYDHVIPVEFGAYASAGQTSEEVLDDMMTAFGAALLADRTLAGLCDWIEVEAPTTEDFETLGAVAGDWGTLNVVASYATPFPLS